VNSILLSVRPEYVERIFSGTKLYEYRKRIPKKPVNKIIIYSTYPVMKVVGEVSIIGIISSNPTSIWEQTKSEAGISRKKYRLYFKGSKVAYALQLGETNLYNSPKLLNDFGVSSPPQSFIYIGD